MYFCSLLEHYGFNLIAGDYIKKFGLPSSNGLFSDLFAQMETAIKQGDMEKKNTRTALNMSAEEKELSFRTRYFVFKKNNQINAEDTYNVMTGQRKKKKKRVILKQDLDKLEEKEK